MGKNTDKYKFAVAPEQAEACLAMLQLYVAERAKLLEIEDGKSHCKIDKSNEAIRLMSALHAFKEEVARRVKSPAEAAYDCLRFTIIPNLMDGEDLTSCTIDGIGRINLQDDVSVKVLDPMKLQAWLIENNFEDIIKSTVNAQTLAAFVRRRVKADEDLPTELLEIKPLVRAVITSQGAK